MRSLVPALLFLSGCGIGSPDFFAFGTGSSFQSSQFQSSQGTQTNNGGLTAVAIWASDAPVDGVDRVWITFERILLIQNGRTTVIEDRRQTLDMLALQHGVRRQLAEANVAPGTYDAVRIELATTGGPTHWVEVGDETHALRFADGAEPALEFPAQYSMRPDEEMELQIDFNVRLSVYEVGGRWYLDPTGSMHDPRTAGAIEGTALPGGATISAQVDGRELASAKSGADGFFRLTPVQPGHYDLVVTYKGHAPTVEPNVKVERETTSRGHHFLLSYTGSGSIVGDYIAVSSPGLTVRLVWKGNFIGFAGVDPQSGAFHFPDVPSGLLEVEAWDSVGPLGKRESILVTSGFDSLLEFR